MNTTPPPTAPPPKTAPLAIWSLVLGILGLTCFSILCGIPAVICGHTALSRIKRSSGMLQGEGFAWGGLITGYTSFVLIPIIGLLAAIAIPNFVKARSTAQRNACINNLRQIDGAKQQWAVENAKKDADTPTQTEITRYLQNGQFPMCPVHGAYQINSFGKLPTCSIPGHEL
jgi:hypothetical protein